MEQKKTLNSLSNLEKEEQVDKMGWDRGGQRGKSWNSWNRINKNKIFKIRKK